jgi:hypothetical protein
VSQTVLQLFTETLFIQAGMGSDDAAICADCMIYVGFTNTRDQPSRSGHFFIAI